MSTLEMLQTTNEHKANTYYEKGEEAEPLTLRERYNATPAPVIEDPWAYIWNEHEKGANAQ